MEKETAEKKVYKSKDEKHRGLKVHSEREGEGRERQIEEKLHIRFNEC